MQDNGQRRIYQIPCRRLQMLIYDFFAPRFPLPRRSSSRFRFAFRPFPRFFSFPRSSSNAFPASRAPGRLDAIPEKKVWRNTRARVFPFVRSAIDRVLRKSWNRDLRGVFIAASYRSLRPVGRSLVLVQIRRLVGPSRAVRFLDTVSEARGAADAWRIVGKWREASDGARTTERRRDDDDDDEEGRGDGK